MSTSVIRPREKASPHALRERREPLRPAVLVGGLLASTFLVAITPFNDTKVLGTYIAGNHFPFGAFAVLVLLTGGINPLLTRLKSAWALSPAQLIAIWAMIAVPSGIPSSGLMRYLVPSITALSYYSSPENKWEDTFGSLIDSSLRITDEAAARGFYEGLPPGVGVPWHLWLTPMAVWTIYTLGLYLMMVSLSVLLRRRWADQERFAFPLVQVPVELARAPAPGRVLNDFFRNPRVWAAVLIVTVIHTLNGLHQLYPQVASVRMRFSFEFKEFPWRHAWGLHLCIFPMVIGLGYLLSTEVLLSLWFFHLFFKVQAIVFGVLGIPMGAAGASYGGTKWSATEEAGGTLGLAGWFLWIARHYLGQVFRQAFTGRQELDDSEEPLRYRTAVIGFLLGSAIMVAWLTYFGGSLFLALANVVLGICVFITLAWTTAQGGLIFVQPTFASTETTAILVGSRFFSLQALVVNMLNEQIYRMDLREYMLPSLLNAHKACDEVGLDRRTLTIRGIVPSIALALIAGGIASIALPYVSGGGYSTPATWTYRWAPRITYNFGSQYLVQSSGPEWPLIAHFGGGMLFTLGLMALRKNLSWFSLHPVGFLIAAGYPSGQLWFSLFVAWLLKSAVMKYGGYKTFQTLRPFFLGLVVGDTLNGVAWIVVGLITKTGYLVLPG